MECGTHARMVDEHVGRIARASPQRESNCGLVMPQPRSPLMIVRRSATGSALANGVRDLLTIGAMGTARAPPPCSCEHRDDGGKRIAHY